jgi:hypothetical protein
MRGTRGATRSSGQRLLYPPASLDLRFAETKSLTDAISGQSLITFSRASSGTFTDSAGILRNAAVNSIRNNTMQGAVAGTPGTPPTNWGVTGTADGVAIQIVGTGTENGITYIDIRYSGTATATSFKIVRFEAINNIAATSGQSWTAATYMRIAAGSTANFTGFEHQVVGYAAVGTVSEQTNTPPVLTSTMTRFTTSRTLNNATTAFVTSWFALTFNNGAAVDITLRIGLPQLELGSSATEIIRTTGTINSAPRFDHNPLTGESLGLLVEEQRTNLVTSSATFQPSSAGNPASYTVDQVAPDGTTTASRQTAANPRTFIDYQGIANAQYTFSVYAKAASGTATIALQLKNAASDTVIATESYVTLTTAWRRLTVTGTTNGATAGARIEVIGPVVGAPAGTVFWGAQLEAGAFPTSYIPTTTATATRSADLTSITGSNFGAFRTNLLLRSEEFDNASLWTFIGTITANAGTAPNGAATADLVTTNGTQAQVFQGVNISSGATVTGSAFLKPNGINEAEIVLLSSNNTTPYARATFNISTGVISVAPTTANGGTNASANVQVFPNGWYRCSVTVTYPAVTLGGMRINAPGAAGGLFLWGAQLETGSTATAYIPTTTAAVTVFESSWYRQDEGTVLAEGSVVQPVTAGNQFFFRTSDNGYSNSIALNIQSTGFPSLATSAAGVFDGNASSIVSLPANTAAKLIGAYAANNLGVSLNGATVAADLSATIPTTLNRLDIGSDHLGLNRIRAGTIRRLTYWPQRLPSNSLVAITR